MSKRKNWLCGITRCFSEPHRHRHHHKQQKRSKRRRIWLFGGLKRTEGLLPPSPSPSPSPSPPPPQLLLPVQTTKLEAEKEQSKWDFDVVLGDHQREKDTESSAAVKIQTAYRGYLARKALRALKGFVRLQAIIRGQAVRKQAMTTIKCLQAIVNIQSQVCTKRGQMALGEYTDLQLQGLHDCKLKKTMRMGINNHGRLDDAFSPNEDEVETIVKRKEAILRRQRGKAHSLNHRISTDSEECKVEGHLRYWLEPYVNDQVLSNKERKNLPKHLKLKNTDYLDSLSLHRSSFHTHRKQSSSENTGLSPRSPTAAPAYMAATESARAKARSMSTPRPRLVLVDRAYSDGDSPCKHKSIISPMSSTWSEMTCGGFSRVSNKSSCSDSQMKSPTLKGLPSPVRSNSKKLGGG